MQHTETIRLICDLVRRAEIVLRETHAGTIHHDLHRALSGVRVGLKGIVDHLAVRCNAPVGTIPWRRRQDVLERLIEVLHQRAGQLSLALGKAEKRLAYVVRDAVLASA